jgi:cytochrome c-type biogenesis protein CcmH/NrfF
MRRFRSKVTNSFLLVALFAGVSFAQSAEQLESPAVNRVADRLNCPCGCKTNMACRMDPYPCRTCWDNKKKILKMEQAGMSDQAILATFASEMGPNVVVVPPGILGSLSFYTAAGLGLILVVFVIRRLSRKAAPVAPGTPGAPDDPLLTRYHDQIEKERIERELDKLD